MHACVQVLTAANLDSGVIGSVAKRLDDVMESKDGQVRSLRPYTHTRARALARGVLCVRTAAALQVRELQAELQRVIAAHNRLIASFEMRLSECVLAGARVGQWAARARACA